MSDQTVTVGIEKDEWYPVYTFSEGAHAERFDVPAELVQRAMLAEAEFDAVQYELHSIYRAKP